VSKNLAFTLVMAGLLSGCVPTVGLQVLKPADVALPADVKTIAVIDRSRPTNVGQGILGTLEGALTGEAIGADRDGGKEAVSRVARVLENSPRFDVVVPTFDRKGQDSSLFDKELEWPKVRKITKSHGAQALVSLEALDSDSTVETGSYNTTETNDAGREVNKVVHTATRQTRVVTAWRLYYPKTPSVVDDLRDYAEVRTWKEEGSSPQEARNNLPAQYGTVIKVSGDAGTAYGIRIAPTWINVSRSYFSHSDARMKAAKNHVKARDWTGAAKLWREVAQEADPKLRGKAKFNLALFNEVEGRLRVALDRAKEAAVDFPKGRTQSYVRILERRLVAEARLQEQMKAVEEKPQRVHPSEMEEKDEGMTRPDEKKEGMTRPEEKDEGMTRPE
jgi:hypothetical protein